MATEDRSTPDEGSALNYLEDIKDPLDHLAIDTDLSFEFAMVSHVKNEKMLSKDARLPHEQRWLQSFRNFRGVYSSQTQYTETERSKVFIKISKTKTLAAVNQINDVIFSSGVFPLGIEPTRLPEGVSENAVIMSSPAPVEDKPTEKQADPYGYEGDGQDIGVGRVANPYMEKVIEEAGKSVKEGVSSEEGIINFRPADIAAKKMQKTIYDQLGESKASIHIRKMVHEMCMLGTGVLRGPFSTYKVYNSWEIKDGEDGEVTSVYKPIRKLVPEVERVSIWDVYNDPNATCVEDSRFLIQRRSLTRYDLRDLAKRPFFRKNMIAYILGSLGPNYIREWYETELSDSNSEHEQDRYEVLEYWGYIDAKKLDDLGIGDHSIADTIIGEQVQVNIWVVGNHIIRCIVNPYTPARIPYLVIPYELNPYDFWGVGVVENMSDAQMIMNGHARMAIDNLALAGNMVFEIDESNLVPGEDLRLFPGKIFRRKGGPPGQAIFSHKFNSTANENMQMFDKFRQLADESTGIPSYSHGQTGVSGTTRTSSGMSMLMGASSINIKGVVKNMDDFLFRPLGESMFAWNMQFNPDKEIQGDLEVHARGTSSLMQKEVRSQRLMMFMQVAANPALTPFVKWPTILREIAQSLEIDPDKFTNTPEEAQIQAMMIGSLNAQQAGPNVPGAGPNPAAGAQPPSGPGGPQGVPPGAGAGDPTGAGGGTIGTGIAPGPGQSGFSGNS